MRCKYGFGSKALATNIDYRDYMGLPSIIPSYLNVNPCAGASAINPKSDHLSIETHMWHLHLLKPTTISCVNRLQKPYVPLKIHLSHFINISWLKTVPSPMSIVPIPSNQICWYKSQQGNQSTRVLFNASKELSPLHSHYIFPWHMIIHYVPMWRYSPPMRHHVEQV